MSACTRTYTHMHAWACRENAMAEGTKLNVVPEDGAIELVGGIVSIPAAWLLTAPMEQSNARGIVLANRRIKVHVMFDGKPVEYTLSLYAQRAPIGEAEQALVDAAAKDRKVRVAEKAATEQATREREIQRAVSLTKDVTFEAVRQANAQAQSLASAVEV